MAEVVVSFDAWPEGKISPTTHEITVLTPRKGVKREPVTRRLIKTLPHPDRKAAVGTVKFSPDGARLMTAGYPSGIVQFWDAATWKETARIDTPRGSRSTLRYAHLTPDWKSVLADTRTRKVVREEKDGKVQERLQIDGRIDRYDAATGKLLDTIPFKDRGPAQLFVTPDGKSALVNVEGSFAAKATQRPSYMEIVDLATKSTRKLLDSQAFPAFAPDGRTAFFSTYQTRQGGRDFRITSTIVKYDLAAGKALKVAKAPDEQTMFNGVYLSPDGKWVVSTNRKFKPASVTMVVLAADTLEEVARLPGAKEGDRNAYFEAFLFTPDGKTMITRHGGPLIVWDMEGKKVARRVPVGDLQFATMGLSPDGKRAAVAGMPQFDSELQSRTASAADLLQPRLMLVDLADPKREPEVLMLPDGAVNALAFSPDGKTLALGAFGGVHLIDLSRSPK